MPSYINTNISSLNAQRNLNTSQTALSTSLQRLSSGLRINSARDDAAGMAISSRMTSQINGNNQAARNANDGISLAQTAEGDLAQIGTNLQRMRDLAVQSANATNTASDRAALNAEVQSLAQEIDRVAQNSSFNGVKLLDGSFTAQVFQVGAGATANDQISISSIGSARITQLGGVGSTTAASVTGTAVTGALTTGALTLNGVQVGASVAGAMPGQSTASASSVATAINAVSSTSGVNATANATTVTGVAATSFTAIAANAIQINGVNVGAVAAGSSAAGQGANVAAAINLVASQTGVTASADAATGVLTLTATDGRDIIMAAAIPAATQLAQTGLPTAKVGVIGTSTVVSGAITNAVITTSGTTASTATVAVDGITLFTNSSSLAGNLISAANLDNAWAGFAAAHAGYTLTGTFAAGTAQITKADGTAIDITSTIVQGTGATATALTAGGAGFIGTTAATPAGVTVASGAVTNAVITTSGTSASTATVTVDGLTLFTNSSSLAGNLISAANLDDAWTAFAAANAGYSLTGTFAAGTAKITKADGTAVTVGSTIVAGTGATATAAVFAGTGFVGTSKGSIANHGTVSLSSNNAAGIVVGGSSVASAGLTAGTTSATTTSSVASLSGMNVSTAASANAALSIIDGALATVNSSRASLGAFQNRFASVVTSLQTTSENLTASRSRIMDTDFAAETSSLTRNQILQQAGTAMLAQANQIPNGVLALLR